MTQQREAWLVAALFVLAFGLTILGASQPVRTVPFVLALVGAVHLWRRAERGKEA